MKSSARRNRRDRTLIVEVRLDFVRFHSLIPGSDDEFQHPIESNPVLRFERNCETREIERVLVYTDYLRDYLAAREKFMLVSSCIDRFANCSAFGDLDFPFVRGERLAPGLSRDLEPREGSTHHGPGARCILWHTLAIPPFGQMKVERNPWYIGSATPTVTGLQFRVGPDGTPLAYEQAHPATFLYFDRAVLERYVSTPDFRASFHQRYWGGVGWGCKRSRRNVVFLIIRRSGEEEHHPRRRRAADRTSPQLGGNGHRVSDFQPPMLRRQGHRGLPTERRRTTSVTDHTSQRVAFVI